MQSLFLVILGATCALATWTPPTSVSDCFNPAPISDAMKAQFQKMHTCVEGCTTAAGMKPNPAHKTCFQTSMTATKAFFTGNTEIQTNEQNFQKCVTSTCTTAQPQSSSEHHMGKGGPHAYNDSSPRDHKKCASGLLMEVLHSQAPTMSSAVKSTLHSCMKGCHPDAAEHSSQSSQSSQSSGHHKRHHMDHMEREFMCMKHFCSKDDFKQCRPPKDATLEAQVHTFMESQFSTLCGCLGGSTTQCTVNKSTCSALFSDMEAKRAAWKAAHSSASTST